MKTYFVRLSKDRQVVGIFCAASAGALWSMVDECTDPGACEYLIAGEGGLYQPKPIPGQSTSRHRSTGFRTQL